MKNTLAMPALSTQIAKGVLGQIGPVFLRPGDVAASCCTDRDKPDGSSCRANANLENGGDKRNKICADFY